jgi:hypothetical protein
VPQSVVVPIFDVKINPGQNREAFNENGAWTSASVRQFGHDEKLFDVAPGCAEVQLQPVPKLGLSFG